jgi:hypothetical protein
MKFRYIGDSDNPPGDTTAYGVSFPAGEIVDVSHLPEWQQEKLAGNWHFELVGGKKRGRPRKSIETLSDDELEALTAPDEAK